jgi:hypothetical protein
MWPTGVYRMGAVQLARRRRALPAGRFSSSWIAEAVFDIGMW